MARVLVPVVAAVVVLIVSIVFSHLLAFLCCCCRHVTLVLSICYVDVVRLFVFNLHSSNFYAADGFPLYFFNLVIAAAVAVASEFVVAIDVIGFVACCTVVQVVPAFSLNLYSLKIYGYFVCFLLFFFSFFIIRIRSTITFMSTSGTVFTTTTTAAIEFSD